MMILYNVTCVTIDFRMKADGTITNLVSMDRRNLQIVNYVEKFLGYPGEYFHLEVPRPKNPWGLRPLGFLALELPKDNIHQDTPKVFLNIVSIF